MRQNALGAGAGPAGEAVGDGEALGVVDAEGVGEASSLGATWMPAT